MTLPTVDEVYETCVMKKTINTLKDNPLHEFYYVAQYGSRYIRKSTHEPLSKHISSTFC